MNKLNKILILVVILLIISGCKGGKKGQEIDVNVGTEGLVMNFIPNNPPDKIYSGTPIDVMFELRNKGNYDIKYSDFELLGLWGYDPNIFILNRNMFKRDIEVEGKSRYNPEGGYYTGKFEGQSLNNQIDVVLPEQIDHYTPTLQMFACYRYKTKASPVVCVDPNPWSTTIEKVCTIQDVALAGGQGAPVAVTMVEEDVLKDRIQFKITIQNVGNGIVIDQNYLSKCFDISYDKVDVVDIEKVSLGGRSWQKCNPNKIRLINGQGSTYCYFDKPTETISAYTSPLQIVLKYGYKSSIQKTVEVIQQLT